MKTNKLLHKKSSPRQGAKRGEKIMNVLSMLNGEGMKRLQANTPSTSCKGKNLYTSKNNTESSDYQDSIVFNQDYKAFLRTVLADIEPDPTDEQLTILIAYIELRKQGMSLEEAVAKLWEVLE